jgi:hypothetical protein
MKFDLSQHKDTHAALYRYDRISWNGFAQYVSSDEDASRVFNMPQALYHKLSEPSEIMVIVVPMRGGTEIASQKSGSA